MTLAAPDGTQANGERGAAATVVVVNWNGAHLLPHCLDGLRRQRCSFRFHTVVVDNASTDDSLALLASRYPEVEVLRNEANLGFAGGNNTALRRVRTPYAVLLNNDAVPEPDWLERLLAPFEGPGGGRLAAVTGKVLFASRYVPLRLSTEEFRPGGADPRSLGVRIVSVTVDGRDVTADVLWEQLTFGPEGPAHARFFWTRPSGEFLLPVAADAGPVNVTLTWTADRPKGVTVGWDGGQAELAVDPEMRPVTFELPGDVGRVDVINNAGGIVLSDGYGADRAYQLVDTGQCDEPTEVFTACGNGMAVRTWAGAELGWFDDDFFLYYEDTDLSWRLQLRGWRIRYEPSAVLRHEHAASSQEWSPLFVFHVDRNRLLMLTKDATAGLALREVLHYPLTTASMTLRALRQMWRTRSRPPLRPLLLRLRVMLSYLRLLPRMLHRRTELSRGASRRRGRLQRRWLVDRAVWSTDRSATGARPEVVAVTAGRPESRARSAPEREPVR